MAQVGIVAFDRVRLAFVGQRLMLTRRVDQVGVGDQLIRIVKRLDSRFIGQVIADDAAGGRVCPDDDIDSLSLSETVLKVALIW